MTATSDERYPFADIDLARRLERTEARRQGAQLALLEERLRYAASRGCTIGMMGAAPGSGSQRNAERHGFRIAYTRTKWQLNQPGKGSGDNGGL